MAKYKYKVVCRNCGNIEGMNREGLDLSRLRCFSCKSVGSYNYVKLKERSNAMKRKWKLDDRVVVDFDGEPYSGSISKLTKSKATILFDDGDVFSVKLKDLKPEPEPESESEPELESESEPKATGKSRRGKKGGYIQYTVEWDKPKINFKFKAESGVMFYGWWRKVPSEVEQAFGVDLMVEYKGSRYNVDTLHYYEHDPRNNINSLNADLCAAANKWLYQKCQGTFDTIESLQQRAAKPTIRINRLETLDKIILKLKEYRDVALRSGGTRTMMFTGDFPETDPSMRIQMDLTKQALGLKGKAVPSLINGVMLDEVATDNSKKKKGRGKSLELTPDPKLVESLISQLKLSKDKAEKRKLRSALRKMGHRGGTRSIS